MEKPMTLHDEYREEMFQRLAEAECLLIDGFDDSIIGTTVTNGQLQAVYSAASIILTLEHEMTDEEAVEYFDYNIVGGLPKTPTAPVILDDVFEMLMSFENDQQLGL
jgi:hypothetical protein